MFKKQMKDKIFEICNAYESGYGHGYEQDGKFGDYYSDPDMNEAYKHGYDVGFDKRSEELFQIKISKEIGWE